MSIRANVPTAMLSTCLFIGVLAFLACDDDSTGPESTPPVLTVSPSHQWAGGEVRISITGDMFEDGGVVVAGADTLEVFDRQSFLLGVRLPTVANGSTTLTVLRDGEALGSVTVEAYGFEAHRVYPVPMNDEITEYPVEWGVGVVSMADGGGDTSKGFSWIHPSTGISRHFPGSSDPGLKRLFRVGVDPISGELYYEDSGPIHRGRIIGGELVDLGWVNRPCQRWGCEPLAGDIWVVLEGPSTCRVVQGQDGESCVGIHYPGAEYWGDDPWWIARLWSSDIALVEHAALRISTGELAYVLNWWNHPTGFLGKFHVTTDERRGFFYASTLAVDEESELISIRIRSIRGEDGVIIRSVDIPTGFLRDEACWIADCAPELAYDPDRDVILIHRHDTRTVEFRDPELLQLKGEVALAQSPAGWYEALVLVDPDMDRAYVVYSGARDPGTPVVSIRLPPI